MASVLVSSVEGEKFRQQVKIGPHALIVDEPKTYGGGDAGPDPYALLLAALGSCTSMTIKLYADRHKIPVEHVDIELSHERIHAKDCEECEKKEGMIERITRRVRVRGPLTDEQFELVGGIARKCPVNRTLEGKMVVKDIIERA